MNLDTMRSVIEDNILSHHETLNLIDSLVKEDLLKIGLELIHCLERGGKVLFCGNGGSAADAQHLAAEFVGRFKKERKGLAAIALTTDTSAITAIGNDYSFDVIFSRQVEALAQKSDIIFGISTSGNSLNVVNAIESGNEKGCITVGLLGGNGGLLKGKCNYSLIVPCENTARIQEMHIMLGHILCNFVDESGLGE